MALLLPIFPGIIISWSFVLISSSVGLLLGVVCRSNMFMLILSISYVLSNFLIWYSIRHYLFQI